MEYNYVLGFILTNRKIIATKGNLSDACDFRHSNAWCMQHDMKYG